MELETFQSEEWDLMNSSNEFNLSKEVNEIYDV